MPVYHAREKPFFYNGVGIHRAVSAFLNSTATAASTSEGSCRRIADCVFSVMTWILLRSRTSTTWIRLIWNLERVGNLVHYITLTVADQTYNVDVYYGAQPN